MWGWRWRDLSCRVSEAAGQIRLSMNHTNHTNKQTVSSRMQAAGRKCGTQKPRFLRHAPRIWVPALRFAAAGMTLGG